MGFRALARRKWLPSWITGAFAVAVALLDHWGRVEFVIAKAQAAMPFLGQITEVLLSRWFPLLLLTCAMAYAIWSDSRKTATPTSVAAPQASDWEDLERRFALIPGEVDALWHYYPATNVVKWFWYPAKAGGVRDVQRFESEAKTGGAMLARLPAAPARYQPAENADAADRWLNAVAVLVDPATSFRGSGRDEDGEHETRYLSRAVDASKVACARLAADSRSV
jgi:hypothetical protein